MIMDYSLASDGKRLDSPSPLISQLFAPAERQFIADWFALLPRHDLYWNRIRFDFNPYALFNFPKNVFHYSPAEMNSRRYVTRMQIEAVEFDLSAFSLLPEFSDRLFTLPALRSVCLYHPLYRPLLDAHPSAELLHIFSDGHRLSHFTDHALVYPCSYFRIPADDPDGFPRMLSHYLISKKWQKTAITYLMLETDPDYPWNAKQMQLSTDPDAESFPYTPDSPIWHEDQKNKEFILRQDITMRKFFK